MKMDINKNNIILGLMIICPGLIGLIFYLTVPLSYKFHVYLFSIIISIVGCILGLIILVFGFPEKLLTLGMKPGSIMTLCALGVYFLISLVLDPLDSPGYLPLGLYFEAQAGVYSWFYLKEQRKRHSETSS